MGRHVMSGVKYNYHFDVSYFSETSANSEDFRWEQRRRNRHKGSDSRTSCSHVFPGLQRGHGVPIQVRSSGEGKYTLKEGTGM